METVGAEDVEDDANVLQILHLRGTFYQYVIEKYKHEPAEVRLEDIVHECLEGGRGVGEAKQHHQKLIVPLVSAEHRLADVVWVHAHLVIARMQVQLREEVGTV